MVRENRFLKGEHEHGVFRCENIHFRTAEMGYYIGESYWGHGLGTSAVNQVSK